jgi:hypothetical protein
MRNNFKYSIKSLHFFQYLVKILSFFTVVLLYVNSVLAQNTPIKAQMLGTVDFREATVWVQTFSNTNIKLTYWKHKDTLYTSHNHNTTSDNYYCTKLVLDKVEPGYTYYYKFIVDGVEQKDVFKVSTPVLWLWRTKPADFTFAIGSCHYSNESVYDRPGKGYGDSLQIIFNTIASKKPEFMLWLGDNIYLREPDWNTKTGIYKRYTHMRSNPAYKNYLPNALTMLFGTTMTLVLMMQIEAFGINKPLCKLLKTFGQIPVLVLKESRVLQPIFKGKMPIFSCLITDTTAAPIKVSLMTKPF